MTILTTIETKREELVKRLNKMSLVERARVFASYIEYNEFQDVIASDEIDCNCFNNAEDLAAEIFSGDPIQALQFINDCDLI